MRHPPRGTANHMPRPTPLVSFAIQTPAAAARARRRNRTKRWLAGAVLTLIGAAAPVPPVVAAWHIGAASPAAPAAAYSHAGRMPTSAE